MNRRHSKSPSGAPIVEMRRVAALLHAGLEAEHVGRSEEASSAYFQVLGLWPENPDALQLLGLLAKRQGRAVEAEALMRRSLRSQPAQANVWNNLGNLLEGKPDWPQAQASFEQAIGIKPDYADAHYNLARVLRLRGHLVPARAAVDKAIAIKPGTPGMLHLRAMLDADEGHIEAALATLDEAIQIAPQRAQLHHNRGVALHRLQRHADALVAFDQAQNLGLDEADLHYNRGNTLQGLGRTQDALAAYQQALQRDPTHALALFDVARLRWRLGDPEFCAELDAAQTTHPLSATAPSLRAQLFLRAQRYPEAAEAYALALQRAPDAAVLHDGLAQTMARLGDPAKALLSHQRAVALAPNDVNLRSHHCATLLTLGDFGAAHEQAQIAADLAPNNQFALALLGVCWRGLGNARERWLNDYAKLVAIFDLEPPTGWADMASFNAELALELLPLHADSQAPIDQTLRQGTQTLGDLLDQQHPLVRLLRGRIEQAITRYLTALTDDMTHPMLRHRHGPWRIADSWSSRLRAGGHHLNHVHPHGWISATYYVAVPPVASDRNQKQGWLQFGGSDIALAPQYERFNVPQRWVEPVPGRLVLFPSYMWHGTTSFNDTTHRLTIAFDVKPS